MADNWKHRGRGMRCETCISFVVKEREDREAGDNPLGRCRRYAPTMRGFVPVFSNDWCGEHRLDENKVEIVLKD